MEKIFLLTCISIGSFAISQKKQLPAVGDLSEKVVFPAEAKPFVLQGYEKLDYITGDLNGDERPDAILILKVVKEEAMLSETPRPLLLLIRQPNGQLRLNKRNDQIVTCRLCNGGYNDPYEATSIHNNSFEIKLFHMTPFRRGISYCFQYKPTLKNWLLVEEGYSGYDSLDLSNTEDYTIPASELDQVGIDAFGGPMRQATVQWKVISKKAFFYDNPILGEQHRKSYVIRGDVVTEERELKNFVRVYVYKDTKNATTHGFILKKHLRKLDNDP